MVGSKLITLAVWLKAELCHMPRPAAAGSSVGGWGEAVNNGSRVQQL